MAQTFHTYEQQLDKLMFEKMLSIPNRVQARNILEKISYYSLINGYKEPFKHSASGNYKHGVTFDEIVSFYHFDEELRALFLKYILHIERHMKSLISYYFCEKFGNQQQMYLDINNYILTKKNRGEVNKYGNVPLWVVMNALTFGQVSKLYQYIPNDIQYKISKKFSNVTERELHQFITVIAKCRNICAHGERLFSFHIRETIPNTILHDKLNISIKKGQYVRGKQDLFAVVIALRYLVDNEEFKAFKAELTRNIKRVLKKCPHISKEQLLKEMGFPLNWDKITRFKK